MLSLSAAALLLNGTQSGRDVEFTSVGTDSRAIMPGMLFVALKGERFDGHDYVAAALAQGANGALVDTAWATAHPELSLVGVADTRLALGRLAAHWRARFHLPLIGVTGSNGKTTVKEMCATILRADHGQHAVLATTGNLNNDIGLPLMLLRLRASHRAAVIEMGMNHAGEIDYLTHLAQPTVALVNNAQRAHLAGLGSLADIARAKGEIFAGLAPSGIAVINLDDPQAQLWLDMNPARHCLTFGFASTAQVRGEWREAGDDRLLRLETPAGGGELHLRVPGEHNARNALAAAAACLAAGVPLAPILRGLAAYAGTPGRLQDKAGVNGATVIDDSYNANPDSMRAAIDVLAQYPGERIFIMGDMGEVGDTGPAMHEEIGAYAKEKGIDKLFALGTQGRLAAAAFGEHARHFPDHIALAENLRPLLGKQTTALVKGSRFMKMERVVAEIVAPPPVVSRLETGDRHAA